MAYIYDLTDTWNAGGTTFNAVKMNVTDTASASGSKLVTLQTNGTEHFSVTKAGVGYFSGNVGVGTAASGARLDINGNIRSTVGSGGTLSLFETDAIRANHLISGADASGSFINSTFSTGGSAVLRIQTANTERMRITGTGNVGINTSAPGGKLEIVDTTTVLRLNSTYAGGNYVDLNPFVTGIANSGFSINIDGNIRQVITNAGNLIVGGGTDYPVASDRTLSVAGSSFASLNLVCGGAFSGAGLTVDSAGELQIRNSGTERMRLKAGGQVRFFPLAAAPASPQAGDVYYDSTTNKLRCYNGTIWNDLF